MRLSAAQPPPRPLLPAPGAGTSDAPGFDCRDIASYYAFPPGFDGTGTTIAIVSLYGGFRRSDLDIYFSAMGMTAPAVEVIAVGGAANNPVADPAANAELVLSLEMLGSIAPGARLAVYLAPSNDMGVDDGLGTAINDRVRHPDVLCLPWALAESGVSPSLAAGIDDQMNQALALGLPVCAPAGVWADGILEPGVPGSHPLVLACGATRAVRRDAGLAEQPPAVTGSAPSASRVWPMERWQSKAVRKPGTRGRLIPDVSALADEQIGYRLYVNGRWVSGSSPAAAACIWAALLARLQQALGRPWGMVSDLYTTLGPAGALSAVAEAEAGPARKKAPAWDSRTGWGSPDGERILAQLAATSRRRRR